MCKRYCDDSKKVIPVAVVMLSAILVLGVLSVGFEAQDTDVFASHGTDTASCEGDGLYDGKNNPFSQELYDMCGETYYDAFIDGCMSVEDNTRDDCESVTDAD